MVPVGDGGPGSIGGCRHGLLIFRFGLLGVCSDGSLLFRLGGFVAAGSTADRGVLHVHVHHHLHFQNLIESGRVNHLRD